MGLGSRPKKAPFNNKQPPISEKLKLYITPTLQSKLDPGLQGISNATTRKGNAYYNDTEAAHSEMG